MDSQETSPLIMGILNVTPDSFSDGGNYFGDVNAGVERAERMIAEGADIIDIGGESTRPGATPVSLVEELNRTLPVIEELVERQKKKLLRTIMISIDTTKAWVAAGALQAGATIVNTVGSLSENQELAEVVLQHDAHVIITHILKPDPRKDLHSEIRVFFERESAFAQNLGIARDRLFFDPGVGFAKTPEQSVEVIQTLDEHAGFPLVIGVSRKNHLGKILQAELGLREKPGPLERLEAALAETAIAVQKGAKIIRTHDVASTKKFLAVFNCYL